MGANPGDFSISWTFGSSEVPLPAGPVDIRIQFDSDNLNANDQDLFIDQYGIRSFVIFDYNLTSAIRGRSYDIDVSLSDHSGTPFAPFEGNFTLDFDDDSEWNSTGSDGGE